MHLFRRIPNSFLRNTVVCVYYTHIHARTPFTSWDQRADGVERGAREVLLAPGVKRATIYQRRLSPLPLSPMGRVIAFECREMDGGKKMDFSDARS